MIPEAVIGKIRKAADLVQLVSEKVELTRDGKEFVGLCPFHEETTPSFRVYPGDDPHAHCFGCGWHGDVFAFMMQRHGWSFPEAVTELARRFGIAATNGDGAPGTPPPSLEAFAEERKIPRDVLARFGVRPVTHRGRPALRYPTPVGIDRLKFTDGAKPKYTWATSGGRAHWYGLEETMTLLATGGDRLYVVNGEPSVWACVGEGVPAICVACGEGTKPPAAIVGELEERLAALGRPVSVAVVYDADAAGKGGGPKVGAALREAGLPAVVLDLAPSLPDAPKGDVDDLHQRVGPELEQVLAALPEQRVADVAATILRAVTVRELLALDIPPREYLLEPILREKETAMLHAWRGVGKTYFGLEVAVAIASGSKFLRWTAPRRRRVVYIDGEMPLRTMQERVAAIIKASEHADAFDPANLRLICADLQDEPLPSLATMAGQQLVEPFVAEADFITVDSISTLAGGGKENEAESWLPMQAWALDLRRRGKSVLFLHHDGKGREQRGTSRKEDILDVVIHLRRPADYEPSQGARFEVHFGKSRGLVGADAEPFEAQLGVVEGQTRWTIRKLEDVQVARAAALFADGCKPADVAQELGVSRATVYRLRAKAVERGLLR